MKYINLMNSCNVKPILVFDGMDLPSKAETDLKRREAKELNRKKAAEYLIQGNKAAAQECFERSVFVTHEMAYEVLRAARNMGVDCIVAPYEADAQLAYLNRTGYADFVITEDSDLLLFGCRQVLFKLDLSGSGILVAAAAGICECCGIPPSQFTESKFRYMGIMAGCDYFSGIPGIGLTTAAKILRQTRITNFRELLSKLGFYVKLSSNAIADDSTNTTNNEVTYGKRTKAKTAGQNKNSQISSVLIDAAVRAERTFRLQVVFDVASRCQKRFSEPTPEDIEEEMHNIESLEKTDGNEVVIFGYAGRVLKNNEKAFNLALGNINYSDGTVVDSYTPNVSKCTSSNGALVGHSSLQTKLQTSRVKPNPDRLKTSIFDKNYPIQKLWLRRAQNGCIEPVADVFSLSSNMSLSEKENKSPLESSPVKLAGLKRAQSTYGKQILVPTNIQERLKNLTNDAISHQNGLHETSKRPCFGLEKSPVDDTSDVLQSYGQTYCTPTTPKLKRRSCLSSTIVSASRYFTEEDKVDDVAVAIDNAVTNLPNGDSPPRLNTSHSPVFYKASSNPFRLSVSSALSSKPKVNGGEDILVNPINEDLHNSPSCRSDLDAVRRSSFDLKCFQFKKSSQSSGTNSSPVFVDPIERQNRPVSPTSPDLNNSTADSQDSLSNFSSPSFLNSHKISSQNPNEKISPNEIVSNHNSAETDSCFSESTSLKENSVDINQKQDYVSKLSKTNFKFKSIRSKTLGKTRAPPVQSTNLDSFFQKWKFKRSST
nr:unnamed protein product [Trichobilharzia regenti]